MPQANSEESIQKMAMNGAQVSSMIEILSSVAGGTLPRDTGIEALKTAFMIDDQQASQIMGSIGDGFKATTIKETY